MYTPGKHNMAAAAVSRFPCNVQTGQDENKIDTDLIDCEILSTAVSFLTVDNMVAITLDKVGEQAVKDKK